jgi:hypothetical protein
VPKGAKKPEPDPRYVPYCNFTLADVKQLIPKLEAANRAGAAVYVMVNECMGARCKENVSFNKSSVINGVEKILQSHPIHSVKGEFWDEALSNAIGLAARPR